MTNNIPHEIHVEEGKKYLSEVFTEGYLPYGILNKSTPGCGGTTVALRSPYNYIVFVPTIELIKNKCSQYNDQENVVDILAVYGDFDSIKGDINYHLNVTSKTENPIKIIATYDSAPKLLNFLEEEIVKNCYILVDEFHSLMIDYDFRTDAIENLIKVLDGHPKTTYMSATPFNPEYGPYQLQKLPLTIIKWPNVIKPFISLQQSSSPLKSVKAIIVHDFAGRPVMELSDQQEQPIFPEQYFFFINNVHHISSIIEDLPLSIRDHMCIVCTDNENNQKTLGDLENLVGSTNSLKRYNFLTKRAYYGCDIYSRNGLSIVVTNIHRQVTLLDVNTDIIQISGRIRNEENPFKNILVHIYNKLPENTPLVDFKYFERQHLQNTRSNITNVENYNRHMLFKYYLYTETYRALDKAYNIAQIPYAKIDIALSLFKDLIEYYTGRFDEILRQICGLYENEGDENYLPEKLKLFIEVHPIVIEAINVLGVKKIKSLRFREGEIRKALRKERYKGEQDHQIKNFLKNSLEVGKSYSHIFLKDFIQEVYRSLGIEDKATATHIKRYCEVKVTSISNGCKGTNGAFKILAFFE